MRGLNGKNILVTGGASGIGQATATRFLEEGCAVCVLDRSAEARAQVSQALPELNGVIDADVADMEQVQAAFGEAIDRMGSVDVLINNGYPHYADYSASKGGVIALTQAMALELAPVVRVNAISPGYVLTPMQRAEYTDAMLDAVNRKIPLRRHAKPEEIAALFAFLASEDAAFATGHVYVMDGAETTGGLCSQWAHE
jgi:meso-butanediol dehydrogenase/(S,S)-butanediol dehydrogenase/diacetyl reductase